MTGGGNLNNNTGREFEGPTIIRNNDSFEGILLTDDDPDFDDDRSQVTQMRRTSDAVSYGNNTRIEPKYSLTLRDPATGQEYEVRGARDGRLGDASFLLASAKAFC